MNHVTLIYDERAGRLSAKGMLGDREVNCFYNYMKNLKRRGVNGLEMDLTETELENKTAGNAVLAILYSLGIFGEIRLSPLLKKIKFEQEQVGRIIQTIPISE